MTVTATPTQKPRSLLPQQQKPEPQSRNNDAEPERGNEEVSTFLVSANRCARHSERADAVVFR